MYSSIFQLGEDLIYANLGTSGNFGAGQVFTSHREQKQLAGLWCS